MRRTRLNEDRIVGAGRELLGKAERGIGDVTGSERLQVDGIVDQAIGAVQHGYGKAKDAIGEIVDDAPGAIAHAADRGREAGRRGSEAIRDRLGDNGPLYLIGGAVALFALGAFAISRAAPALAPKPKPVGKRRPAKATAKSTG